MRKAFSSALGVTLFLFCGLLYGCAQNAPTASPERPPQNYQGPLAEGPVLQADDYWIYKRADGTRIKAGAGSMLAKVEFPLWIGRVWRYDSSAHLMGHAENAPRTPVVIECAANRLVSITVPAGRFDAFQCRCECTIVGASGVYERECGEWTLWYAPQARNIVKTKGESTANAFDLVEYKISDDVSGR
ncbi:MAG TPA: hypothetical protein VGL11_04505 [Candidatus Binatia bacterium]|jgi:hypothetical protein